jgi:hypothetical protein
VFGRLFSLVTIDDDTKIFAWGIEITTSDDLEAVIYRKDPATSHALFGVHDSAQAACDRWSGIVPLRISWDDEDYATPDDEDYQDYPMSASAPPTEASSASPSGNRPRPLVTV